MADIELIIKIPEDLYIAYKDRLPMLSDAGMDMIAQSIANGIPLPKGHGALIDKEELKENINGWYAFMKDICKQPYMTLKQEEIIGKIDIMTSIIEADKEEDEICR